MKINCLVQVTGNNELDFTEWLDYHIALGFTAIYVFDAGNKVWLDSVCEKRRDRVVRVPRSDEWQYKSSIIKEYLARVHNEEWCVCLDDHDFIYINPNAGRNIREYIAKVPERAVACTLYTKHMSSEKPMKIVSALKSTVSCMEERNLRDLHLHIRFFRILVLHSLRLPVQICQ